MELYFMVHPGSPSAVRRPRLLFRSGSWIALLGDKAKNGISGVGLTVEEALSSFDLSYLSALHPPPPKRAGARSQVGGRVSAAK